MIAGDDRLEVSLLFYLSAPFVLSIAEALEPASQLGDPLHAPDKPHSPTPFPDAADPQHEPSSTKPLLPLHDSACGLDIAQWIAKLVIGQPIL